MDWVSKRNSVVQAQTAGGAIMNIILVAAGGFFGAISRFAISNWGKKRYGGDFPYATLFINLLGSFLLGLLVGAKVAEGWRLFAGVGFMGAFTTFSTFKQESIQLHAKKKGKVLFVYLVLSYVLGIGLAFLGFYIGAL
jgi:CrcB protein